MAATKFTRVGVVEGDIWYATTSSSTKSVQSLEDNIDNKMLAFIGVDNTGGNSTSSTSESKIGEVIIPANSANTRFIIIAGVRFQNTLSGQSASSSFRIRTGTSATATSNTLRKSIDFSFTSTSTSPAAVAKYGGVIMATITTSDENFTGQIYVHVTGQNDLSSGSIQSVCDFVYVIGV